MLSGIVGTALLGGLGYLIKKLFDRKESTTAQPITISGDRNTQTTHGGTSAINTGSGHIQSGDTYHIGITLEQYEQGLKRREIEVKVELNKAHNEDRQLLTTELHAIQQQLQNSTASYEAHITSLKERIAQLEPLRGQLPDDALDKAKTALAQGVANTPTSYSNKSKIKPTALSKSLPKLPINAVGLPRMLYATQRRLPIAKKRIRLVPDNGLYLICAGYLAQILGAYQQAKDYYEHALASDVKTYGEDHPSVARDRNNLGFAWASLGEYRKAIEYYKQALASDLKTYGEDHLRVAIGWNNLGSALVSLGEYKKAIGYFEQALASNLKTFGEDYPRVAIGYSYKLM